MVGVNLVTSVKIVGDDTSVAVVVVKAISMLVAELTASVAVVLWLTISVAVVVEEAASIAVVKLVASVAVVVELVVSVTAVVGDAVSMTIIEMEVTMGVGHGALVMTVRLPP